MKNTAYAVAMARMMLLTACLAAGAVVVHEAGHYAAGSLFGCDGVEIVLLDEYFETYTKMNCPPDMGERLNMLFLSGLLFIAPLSVVLFLLTKSAQYPMMIFGFNLMISSSDFALLSEIVASTAILIGVASLMYGEALLAGRHIRYAEAVMASYSRNR